MTNLLSHLKKPKSIIIMVLFIISCLSIYYIYSTTVIAGYSVLSTLPPNGATISNFETPIVFTFQKVVPKNIQNTIVVTTLPKFLVDVSWKNNQELYILPIKQLDPSTFYHISLYLNNKLFYSYSFSTPVKITDDYIKSIMQQAGEDLYFGSQTRKIITTQPFLSKLPISTPSYTIVYDYEKKLIRIRLALNVQKTEVEEEINTKLTNIGVDLKKETFVFVY